MALRIRWTYCEWCVGKNLKEFTCCPEFSEEAGENYELSWNSQHFGRDSNPPPRIYIQSVTAALSCAVTGGLPEMHTLTRTPDVCKLFAFIDRGNPHGQTNRSRNCTAFTYIGCYHLCILYLQK
jgi:hypothetical protein